MSDDGCPAVVQNLWQAQHKCEWLYRMFIREGTDAWTLGRIEVVVVQAVLLYGSETGVMTQHIGRLLGVFHHRVDCRLTGLQPGIGRDGGWVYTTPEEEMKEEG